MENPFNYLQFATGDRFYDREDIRKDLRSRLLSGQTNIVLYGPRRYGKSSLVAELTADVEKVLAEIDPDQPVPQNDRLMRQLGQDAATSLSELPQECHIIY